MMLKMDRDQLAAEIATLEALLESIPMTDLLGRIGLRSRRDELREVLASLHGIEERRAKVALYFGGNPVVGSVGVEAEFATNALGSFQDLLSKVWSVADGGTLNAAGPVPAKSASQLHITQLVHGSFGFMLEEISTSGEPLFESPLKLAADHVAEYISSFADADETRFSEVIDRIAPRVFLSLREFFGYMHRDNATFRLVEGERDERFDKEAIARAWQRADESMVDEERFDLQGELLGLIPMRRRFEFKPDDGSVIEGRVGEQLGESYLERIKREQIAGRRLKASLHRRLVAKVGRRPTEIYTLLALNEIDILVDTPRGR